ncbi:hypothetical protein GBK04_15695 [Cytophagaceae bacterium SJW1-29]|uniref:DUF6249 domain-containing protein n=2 Tax=Salmonirosea aquatica TaxID=2654236 RepID=A0A7C9BDE3_9BACT|nr:hypothetical protein [Cytophagaceae bacterium SJW1-29]
MDDLKHIIISVSAFAGIFGIVYVFMMTRYKERMAMIERKVDASLLDSTRKSLSPTLKFGMLFVGIAIGIIVASALNRWYSLSMGMSLLAMVFLFGGISLILNFIIERRLEK